jgi:hypothetical protein
MKEGGNLWRLTLPVGITLIILGMSGMVAAFPFIAGDPGPGEPATDPAWFHPVATGLVIVLGLGIVLACASPVHWLIRRCRKRT